MLYNSWIFPCTLILLLDVLKSVISVHRGMTKLIHIIPNPHSGSNLNMTNPFSPIVKAISFLTVTPNVTPKPTFPTFWGLFGSWMSKISKSSFVRLTTNKHNQGSYCDNELFAHGSLLWIISMVLFDFILFTIYCDEFTIGHFYYYEIKHTNREIFHQY